MAAALARWLAPPDVLADPFQVEDGRVWTRAEDVLPGVPLVPGRPVTACWDEVTWTALPEWDPVEPGTLWLRPVSGPAPAPDPTQVYGPAPMADRVAALLDRGHSVPDDPQAVHQAWGAAVAELVADFARTVEVAVRAQREDRETARALLRHLADRDRARGAGLPTDRALTLRLLRLARRARLPPRRRGSGRR